MGAENKCFEAKDYLSTAPASAAVFRAAGVSAASLYTRASPWIQDICGFNLAADPVEKPKKYLHAGSLPAHIKEQLSNLRWCKGWKSEREIILALNLPNNEKFWYTPLDYKYIWCYRILYGCNICSPDVEVHNSQIEEPLNSADRAAFMQIF